MATLQEEAAIRNGKEAIEAVIKAHQNFTIEVQRYLQRYQAATNNAERMQILDFVVHFQSVNTSVRLDLALKAAVELASL